MSDIASEKVYLRVIPTGSGWRAQVIYSDETVSWDVLTSKAATLWSDVENKLRTEFGLEFPSDLRGFDRKLTLRPHE